MLDNAMSTIIEFVNCNVSTMLLHERIAEAISLHRTEGIQSAKSLTTAASPVNQFINGRMAAPP